MLQGKHILVGVTGSIAAYKAAMLVRHLVKEGAEVRVVMSAAARDFITPLTLATLCKHPVLVDNFDPTNGAWNSHVRLGEWADHYLIAPATANTLARMAAGTADNLLLCTYLSARCGVSVAPAMDLDMYRHPSTQANLAKLRSLGVHVIEPATGELASGLVGAGRMEEPEAIVARLCELLVPSGPLAGKRVLVTAGATVERIDPVRYLSNDSTGTMGYALADELARRGARVTLVSGAATAALRYPERIERVDAPSAAEMFKACEALFPEADLALFCAAVADYTPAHPAARKIKHTAGQGMTLELRPTVDIAATLGARKRPGQFLLGFALESENGLEHATRKLHQKHLDAIVLNSLSDPGAGFGAHTNQITLLDADGARHFPLKCKREVACDIVEYLSRQIQK